MLDLAVLLGFVAVLDLAVLLGLVVSDLADSDLAELDFGVSGLVELDLVGLVMRISSS